MSVITPAKSLSFRIQRKEPEKDLTGLQGNKKLHDYRILSVTFTPQNLQFANQSNFIIVKKVENKNVQF